MRVAIYARVSRPEQEVSNQLLCLREYCKARQYEVYQEYVDQGISGIKPEDKRPALAQLMDDARKRKVDTVLVWRFDRFARSTKHLVDALNEFNHLGVQFVSYQESVDTSTPMGNAMFSIIAAISQLERDIIRERIMAGLSRAKAQGRKSGLANPKHRLHRAAIDLTGIVGNNSELARKFGVSRQSILRARKRLQFLGVEEVHGFREQCEE